MKQKRAKRNREQLSTTVETVLNSLLLDQIKTIYHHLDIEIPKDKKKKEDLKDHLLSAGRNLKDIEELAMELESSTAPKHFYVGEWTSKNSALSISKKKFRKDLCPNVGELDLLWSQKNSKEFAWVGSFQHFIRTKEWELQPEKRIKIEVEKVVRHPIIVRLYKEPNLIVIAYPGFSSSAGHSRNNPLTYSKVVSDVMSVLTSELKIQINPLTIRSSIDTLLSTQSKRINLVKANPFGKTGKMIVSTGDKLGDVNDWLAKFISPGIPSVEVKELKKAFLKAFQKSSVDSMVVVWTQEDLVTRIEFWDSGAEFLFIWRSAQHSFEICMRIFDLIKSLQGPAVDKNAIVESIVKATHGDLIVPSNLVNRLGVSADKVKEAILNSVKLGWIEPVYRLKTDLTLQEHENNWTENLKELARKFTLDSGDEFNGANPNNIEIAFRRLEAASET